MQHANGNSNVDPVQKAYDDMRDQIIESDRWSKAVVAAIRALQADVELLQVEVDRLQRKEML